VIGYVSPMLSAILLAYDGPTQPLRGDAVGRSLASLVDACVQGLIADAILVGPPGRGLDRIADEAGCALVETADAGAGLAQALELARRDGALLLRAGNAVERGFVDEVNDALTYGPAEGALVLRAAPSTLLTRVSPRFAEPVGVIAPKAALRAAATADFRRLAKALRCAELSSPARRTG
jgi:hypothetical protein